MLIPVDSAGATGARWRRNLVIVVAVLALVAGVAVMALAFYSGNFDSGEGY